MTAEDYFDAILTENEKIATILQDALKAIKKVGEPHYYMCPGYEFKYVCEFLDEMTPLFTHHEKRQAEICANDLAYEDALDENSEEAFRRLQD